MSRPVRDPVLAVQHRLTERDLVLLAWLAEHKTLTTAQIASALFPSLRVAQERLTRLMEAGVVTRFRPFRNAGAATPTTTSWTSSARRSPPSRRTATSRRAGIRPADAAST